MLRFFCLMLVCCGLFASPSYAKVKVVEIPYSKQFRAYSCGHNSFRMVMGYWGTRLSRNKIILAIGIGGSHAGSFEQLIKKRHRDFSFKYVSPNFDSVKKELSSNRPVVVGVNASLLEYLDYESTSGHFIVLVGYDDVKKKFFLRDPNSKYIEEISYNQIKKAWKGRKKPAFAIYRKDGRFVPKNQIKHFDSAKPFGAKKVKKSGIPLSLIVPSVHYTAQNIPRPSVGEGIDATNAEDASRYFVEWNGIGYGDTTLEQSPLLGNGKAFKAWSFNIAYLVSSGRVRLGSGELVSPGVYTYGRHRTLDVHNFAATKKIPALTFNQFALELSAYSKQVNDEKLSYPNLNMEIDKWGGGRLALRRGIGQVLGHASVGLQYAKLRLNTSVLSGGDDYQVVPTTTFDLTLGPIKGSYQTMDTKDAEATDQSDLGSSEYPNIKLEAHSLGLDYNLGRIVSSAAIINLLNYTGIFRPHFEFTREKLTRADSEETTTSITRRKWEVELPVSLGYFDLVYGLSLFQTDLYDQTDISRSAFIKFLYNNLMPFVQLQLGYQTLWAESNRSTGQVVTIGIYAGM